MQTGVVKCWLEDRGFGFITDESGDDVFVHRRALPRGTQCLEEGAKVNFDVTRTDRGIAASRVSVIGGPQVSASPEVLSEEEFRREFGHAAERLLLRARRHGWVR